MDGIDVKLSVDKQGEILESFSRALQREVHNLAQSPILFWQQMHNRLQWESKGIPSLLQVEKQSRLDSKGRPWFRTLTAYRESETYIRSFVGHTGRLSRISFTIDGKKIISAGDDGLICIWDPNNGYQQAIFLGHQGRVHDFCLVNHDDIIISAGKDGTLRAWSISDQKSLGILFTVKDQLLTCKSLPNSDSIFFGDNRGLLYFYQVIKLSQSEIRLKAHIPINCRVAISSMSISPNGKKMACGHADGSVSFWDISSNMPLLIAQKKKHKDVIFSSCFSPDGSHLLTGDGLGMICCWDAKQYTIQYEEKAHEGAIMDCSFTQSGDKFISVGDDSKVRIEEFVSSKTPDNLKIFQGHYRPVTCLGISPSEKFLVSGSDDGTIRIWNLLSSLNLDENKNDGHERWAVAASFSEDGKRLISGSRDGDIILWDIETMKIVSTFGPQPGLEWCDLSPDGNTIISCGDGAKLWDVETGCQTATVLWESPVFWSGFSPDGEVIIGINIKGKHFWDLTEPDPIFVQRIVKTTINPVKKQRVPGPDLDFSSIRCDFSPYGSRIVTPGLDGRVGIWEVDGVLPIILGKHEDIVISCVWNPDGSMVASGGKDGVIKIWNVDDRSLVTTIDAHHGWINQLEFFGSGLLLSVSSDGNAYLWDINTNDLVCIYPMKGDVLLSCATHFDSKLVCITDIAGSVHILSVEFY